MFSLDTRVSRIQAIAFAAIADGFPFFFAVSLVPIPRVHLKRAIALAPANSALAAGFSVFRFPFSVFCFSIFPEAS